MMKQVVPLPRSITDIIKQASKLVTPSREEETRLKRVESRVRKLIEDSFAKSKGETIPEIVLGGSFAKGTWLKGQADVDYFLLYPVTYPREKLEGEAIEIALKAMKGFKVNMRYAEHPYVEAFVESTRLNLVPCYKVEKEKWQSAVDRSPFHAEYIKARFDMRLRLQTRLLKKFVKSANVYGAEVKVQGLSGYVCEVLVLKYDSFESSLEALSSIAKGEVISVEPYDKDLASTFSSALVVLDPVDTTRNLGTAVSPENFGRLILKARSFLSRPSIAYFLEANSARFRHSTFDSELLKRILVVTFQNKPRSDDVLFGQLRKSLSSLASKLETLGFHVLRSATAANENGESALAFLLLERRIGDYLLRFGPDIHRKDDLGRYISKNRSKYFLSWIDKEGKIVSLFKRDSELADPFSAARKLLSSGKDMEMLGLSKAIKSEIQRGFWISDGLSVIRKTSDSKRWLKDCVNSLMSSEIEFEAKHAPNN